METSAVLGRDKIPHKLRFAMKLARFVQQSGVRIPSSNSGFNGVNRVNDGIFCVNLCIGTLLLNSVDPLDDIVCVGMALTTSLLWIQQGTVNIMG